MKKHLLILTTILSMFVLIGCSNKKENIIEVINSSNTSLDYHLLDDNINPKTTFKKYKKVDFTNGYEYITSDGSVVYRFTQIDKYGPNPVMSYLRVSNAGNMNHTLFGIKLGSSTKLQRNEILGVNKTYSLLQYFFDLGFKINFDKRYINQSYYNVDGKYINWHYLVKDEIFLNIALEISEDLKLSAFEIGLNVDEVNDKLVSEKEGLSFSINEGIENLYNEEITLNDKYQGGYLIRLKVNKNDLEKPPSLYINNEFVKNFDIANSELIYSYEVLFFIPTYDVKVDIRY